MFWNGLPEQVRTAHPGLAQILSVLCSVHLNPRDCFMPCWSPTPPGSLPWLFQLFSPFPESSQPEKAPLFRVLPFNLYSLFKNKKQKTLKACFVLFCFSMLCVELWALHTLDKCSNTDLHAPPAPVSLRQFQAVRPQSPWELLQKGSNCILNTEV